MRSTAGFRIFKLRPQHGLLRAASLLRREPAPRRPGRTPPAGQPSLAHQLHLRRQVLHLSALGVQVTLAAASDSWISSISKGDTHVVRSQRQENDGAACDHHSREDGGIIDVWGAGQIWTGGGAQPSSHPVADAGDRTPRSPGRLSERIHKRYPPTPPHMPSEAESVAQVQLPCGHIVGDLPGAS